GVRFAAAICQLTPAKTISKAMTMPRIARIIILVLFVMVLAGRIPRVQSHHDLIVSGPATGAVFAKNFDVGELMGILQRFQKLQLALVIFRSYGQLKFEVICRKPWFDTHNSHTVREVAFQVHKELRPGKSTLSDHTIQKSGEVP